MTQLTIMKYVFEVTIKDGCSAEDYIAVWQAESAIIQKEPGARGTRLHRRIDQPNIFVAIATWESKEFRDAALSRLQGDAQINAIRRKHEHLVDFRLIGELEEPEYEVLPPTS
jgi:heme-degrading monooxygenase HmoA